MPDKMIRPVTTAYLMIACFLLLSVLGCKKKSGKLNDPTQIIYLHHSTGRIIWEGEQNGLEKIIPAFGKPAVVKYLDDYNENQGVNYRITPREFPAQSPYGWQNYPYDYYNIWVKHGNADYYMEEPTLKILTEKYDVVVFKHCFPVSRMKRGTVPGNPDSREKTLTNYQRQYTLLKEKLRSYPGTKFLLWTGPALLKKHTNESEASITKEFYDWVKNNWDTPEDNIFLWDFRELETEGGLYLKSEYAFNPDNSHPSRAFGERAARYFVQRLTDVIRNKGTGTNLTGQTTQYSNQ